MRKLGLVLCTLLLLGAAPQIGAAATIGLFDYGFNVDGTVSLMPVVLAGFNFAGFDFSTGLGIVTGTISGAGAHNVIAFFDHEIDESNNTFFNEVGSVTGAPAAGQSWEIDEPGYVFGDIFTNMQAGALDNSVGAVVPDDVSMAMGWSFTLGPLETATIHFTISEIQPASGFFLTHTDPESPANIYLQSDIRIGENGDNVIPEPGTVVLLLSGLGLAAAVYRRKKA